MCLADFRCLAAVLLIFGGLPLIRNSDLFELALKLLAIWFKAYSLVTAQYLEISFKIFSKVVMYSNKSIPLLVSFMRG